MSAQVFLRRIFGDDQVNPIRAGESLGHGRRILDVANESFGAFLYKSLELFRVASDDADFLASGEQRFGGRSAGSSGCSGDDDHFFSLKICTDVQLGAEAIA